jgi:ABC-type thiamin/hydroxymethylpyrimidine transport system permease subunit
MVTPSSTGQPQDKWRTADWIALIVWAASIAGVSVVWNQVMLLQPDRPTATGWVLVAAFFVGLPLLAGVFAGLFVRRDGTWPELLLMAAVGAASVAFTLYAQWVSDPRTCAATQGTGCDTGYSVGAALVFVFCYIPFVAGGAAGRALSVLLSHSGTKSP